ncbi:uncharacterized protein OCT59_006235 [Rhizophagus irregularis]|uniref:Uncharacterized protein n=1 Tax=Rhizophagus irregularis TaxID=588596 RepID=A0A915ZUY0_9GLOM|nr:hypothetical protein OCT59_006235 [Rhizophagus irregularis]CAB4377206.1 unnamed protein product [Rhizophagus irregularis]CAB5102307.1 unnamed protein product [Rhizophagus irregularis]CAB5383277.1 unnamed protein product [Rhizophagus irregularis]CAB5391176.1 unnamed protein product [Rhizophagus irregularis]
MHLSPCPMRNSIFVVSNRSTTSNNLPHTSTPSENSIYYNGNQSNNLDRNFPQVTTSPLQNSILSDRNQTILQPLVPSGSAINRNNYEPTHRCTTCGHVHTCDDCKHISNIQQVIDPPVKKVHEPIIINTAKAMGRINRRMTNGPYFRPERSRNVLISQDEILHRTMADPNLNFTDIVNQVAKEKEQEQEKAMITGNYSHQNGFQNGHQNGRRQERPLMDSSSITNYQNSQRQQQSNLSSNGFQSTQSPTSPISTSTIRSQSPVNPTMGQRTGFSPTMEGQPVQDQTILPSDFSTLLQGGPSSQPSQPSQEQLLNSNATILTTPDVTIICNEQPSSILTPIIRDSKLVDNSLGYKKTNVQYASSRKNIVASKPRPNPVTPNLKISNGDTLKSMKVFFSKLWQFG